MYTEFVYREKIRVGIVGASTALGIDFVKKLEKHPWFEISALIGSLEEVGKTLNEISAWPSNHPLDKFLKEMKFEKPESDLPCEIVIICEEVSGDLEHFYANRGYGVISNERTLLPDNTIPLIVAEVNHDQLCLIKAQTYIKKGSIVNVPCALAIAVATSLKPLKSYFGIESIKITTKENHHILGREIDKIFSKCEDNELIPPSFQTLTENKSLPENEIAVVDIKIGENAEVNEIIEAWNEFGGLPHQLKLPLSHIQPLKYNGNGKQNGDIRLKNLLKFDSRNFQFAIAPFQENQIVTRATLLNAELMVKFGHIYW